MTSQYDNLTLDDLREFHHQLCQRHTALHNLMMDGIDPRMSPLSAEWEALFAEATFINDAADDLIREIQRREQESLDA